MIRKGRTTASVSSRVDDVAGLPIGEVGVTRRTIPSRTAASVAALSTEGRCVAIGPVQLIVLGFSHPEFHGEIVAELERLRESDTVRVIDALAVHKDADGEIEVQHLSNLSKDEAIELGSKVGALIGLGIEGEEGMEAGAAAGAHGGRHRTSAASEPGAGVCPWTVPVSPPGSRSPREPPCALPLQHSA